jgi:hypothetical protein
MRKPACFQPHTAEGRSKARKIIIDFKPERTKLKMLLEKCGSTKRHLCHYNFDSLRVLKECINQNTRLYHALSPPLNQSQSSFSCLFHKFTAGYHFHCTCFHDAFPDARKASTRRRQPTAISSTYCS